MNSSYLQFLFAMVLVINGIMCDDDEHQHQHTEDCQQDHSSNQGNGARKKIDFSCPTNSSYDTVMVTFSYRIHRAPMNTFENVTINCSEFDGQTVNVVKKVSPPFFTMDALCSCTPDIILVELTASKMVYIRDIQSVLVPGPSVGSKTADPMTTVTTTGQSQSTTVNPTATVTTIEPSQQTSATPMTKAVKSNKTSQRTGGKRNTALIVVPSVVVLVAVFLLVALVATIWCKRRNKQASEGDGTIALNIRSTVNQNEGTVVYNEIGEQDYNTLFGGKERDDYHEYNVPDHPQEKTSVDRTTVSGSGPYHELLKDGTRAVAAVNRSPGVADDLQPYQDLRQDDRSVSSHPNGEMPNQLPSKDTPATENGYQALKTATPEYATLEPSPEYATLEQNDQSVKGTSDVSGPPGPPDKEYDTLQRSINTVGQPPSAGYGTLNPMNEADVD